MKNFEKYIDKIADSICVKELIGKEPYFSCNDCPYGTNNWCDIEKVKQWLFDEYDGPKLSHDEYAILKNVSKNYKYITRDGGKYDLLSLHDDKPERCSPVWYSSANTSLDCYNHLFQFIKWENDEPFEIAKLIEDYEKENK